MIFSLNIVWKISQEISADIFSVKNADKNEGILYLFKPDSVIPNLDAEIIPAAFEFSQVCRKIFLCVLQ